MLGILLLYRDLSDPATTYIKCSKY